MKKIIGFFLLILFFSCEQPFPFSDDRFLTAFEKTNGKEGATYSQAIDYYKELASRYGSLSLRTISGERPIHLVIYNPDGYFDFRRLQQEKTILFINNGLEKEAREGVDATMLLLRNLAQEQITLPKHLAIVALPMFENWEQVLSDSLFDISTKTRYFPNFDDDFLKNDTEATRSFVKAFHTLNPHLFIDTATFDEKRHERAFFYQYPAYAYTSEQVSFLEKDFFKQLRDSLQVKNKSLTQDSIAAKSLSLLPYPMEKRVDRTGSSVGYAALWQTLSLRLAIQKNDIYKESVEELYNALKMSIYIADQHAETIKSLRKSAQELLSVQELQPLSSEIDTTAVQVIDFSKKKDSLGEKEGKEEQKFNELQLCFPTKFKKTNWVRVPESYIVPKMYKDVLNHLETHLIEINPIEKDTILSVSAYKITSFDTRKTLYEGHYKHFDTKTEKITQKLQVYKGDYLVKTTQAGRLYLLQVLEPTSKQSFFNWNFFDVIFPNEVENQEIIYPIFRQEFVKKENE